MSSVESSTGSLEQAPIALGSRGTALIVDDELSNCRLLSRMLGREGFRTFEALCGTRALELFESERPDIVFMDVMMPGLDGLEVTEQIKRMAGPDFVPVIFLTALSDEAAMARCTAAGGDDFLSKPFSFGVLKSRIRAMERVRDLHRALAARGSALSELLSREQAEQALAERVLRYAIDQRNLSSDRLGLLKRSAAVFSGDLVLTQRLPDGGLRILVGDFTGHGLAAAIGVLPVADIFHTMTRKGADDWLVLSEINRKLHRLLPGDRFMAACLVSIPASGGRLCWWNGGLPSGWLRTSSGLTELQAHALPLGIREDYPPQEDARCIAVRPGDRLILMTDGLLEATNQDGQMFEDVGFRTILSDWIPGEAVLANLTDAFDRHSLDSDLMDDVAVLEVVMDSAQAEPETDRQTIEQQALTGGWSWSLELSDDQLRDFPPLTVVLAPLGLTKVLADHIGAIETIVAELYANALEHGVLKLCSEMKTSEAGFDAYYLERARRLSEGCDGWVRLGLRYAPSASGGCVTITVTDSGDGCSEFDCQPQRSDADSLWGRGLELVKALCESVTFCDVDASVKAVYRW